MIISRYTLLNSQLVASWPSIMKHDVYVWFYANVSTAIRITISIANSSNLSSLTILYIWVFFISGPYTGWYGGECGFHLLWLPWVWLPVQASLTRSCLLLPDRVGLSNGSVHKGTLKHCTFWESKISLQISKYVGPIDVLGKLIDTNIHVCTPYLFTRRYMEVLLM